jgi:osmotically-inducible protein OsmY
MSRHREGARSIPLAEQGIGLAKEKQVVQAEARSRLRKSGYRELQLVSCDFHEGILTLRGRISSFYLKQLAQTLVYQLDGVGEVNNRLEVATRACLP